jgi:threonine aldolase
VLISALGPRILRAVTHLDVTAEQCRQAGETLAAIMRRG